MRETFSPVQWNIFVRELSNILEKHGSHLGRLTSDSSLAIHPQKLIRLKKSLLSPKHLPVLNPEEVERVIAHYSLSDIERSRLQAAILATAVERILVERIDPPTAYKITNDVFDILLRAISGLSPFRKADITMPDEEPSGDGHFQHALNLIDRATLAMNLSQSATSPLPDNDQAHLAQGDFAQSLTLLQQSTDPGHETEEWQFWFEEAHQGKIQTDYLLLRGEEQ